MSARRGGGKIELALELKLKAQVDPLIGGVAGGERHSRRMVVRIITSVISTKYTFHFLLSLKYNKVEFCYFLIRGENSSQRTAS